MTDDNEIAWHREQIVKNRSILEEKRVTPPAETSFQRPNAQSKLIVAASEKL
jgi:hypothetical protein